MTDSIFGSNARSQSAGWLGPRGVELHPATKPARSPEARSSDSALIAVLEAPLSPGETAYAGFARKEDEVRALLARLTVLESRALHARLSNPRAKDALASAFARLTIDRRSRLLAFLADARRREATSLR